MCDGNCSFLVNVRNYYAYNLSFAFYISYLLYGYLILLLYCYSFYYIYIFCTICFMFDLRLLILFECLFAIICSLLLFSSIIYYSKLPLFILFMTIDTFFLLRISDYLILYIFFYFMLSCCLNLLTVLALSYCYEILSLYE